MTRFFWWVLVCGNSPIVDMVNNSWGHEMSENHVGYSGLSFHNRAFNARFETHWEMVVKVLEEDLKRYGW
jgi:hypothetical protein